MIPIYTFLVRSCFKTLNLIAIFLWKFSLMKVIGLGRSWRSFSYHWRNQETETSEWTNHFQSNTFSIFKTWKMYRSLSDTWRICSHL
jgi:hypothetical protein